jgi:cation:H+ antiporter
LTKPTPILVFAGNRERSGFAGARPAAPGNGQVGRNLLPLTKYYREKMLIAIAVFCLGIAFLLKGAEYFVEGGGGLASRYGVSTTTIGFTVIAFGTSLPEFVVSLNAVVAGNAGIALGNVLGSNIANIGLVLAICAILRPALAGHDVLKYRYITEETLFMLIATLLFGLLALRGVLDAVAGGIFLLAFVLILWQLWSNGMISEEKVRSHGRMDYVYTVGGLIAVVIGAQLVLDGAVSISEFFGIPDYVIGLSIVAVGTSLPELATSVVAILKGQGGLSVGNLLGSNIFNLLFVMGCGALLRPIPIPSMDMIVVVGLFSLAVVPLYWRSARFTRVWSVLLLGAYAVYMILLFSRA